MECQNCHQPVEAGALFCGNCGHPVAASQQQSNFAPAAEAVLPNYAVATPAQHRGEIRAVLSLLLGVSGIAGAAFRPIIGLAVGVIGLVLATMTRHSVRRGFSTAGLVLSSLAIVAGLAGWTYIIGHSKQTEALQQSSQPTTVTADISTPCYSANLVDRLNVVQANNTCNSSAFNGQTLDLSTNAYKVYANKVELTNVSSFTSLAKTAIEKDIKTNLPTFTIQDERVSGFAGSPAYTVTAVNTSENVSVVEAAVYHPVKVGDTVFIMVHAVNNGSADLKILESQWQWK